VAFIILAVLPAISEPKSFHPFKAHTRFVATSTCIRGTWRFNLDVYLAEILSKKGSETVLARLIDEYGNLEAPISVSALTSATGTYLRVKRDRQCDMPYAQIQLRTAPGDPMAILHERLGYEPQLSKVPQPNEVMSCYRTVRR
jgi:hypothetical protein